MKSREIATDIMATSTTETNQLNSCDSLNSFFSCLRYKCASLRSAQTYNLNDRDEDGRPILLQKMIETDFVGASGRVAFSSDTHERMITTIPYQVNNVRKSASANRR